MDYYEETHLTRHGEDYWETRLISGYADGYLFRSNRVSGYTVNAKTAVPWSELDYAMLSEGILLYPMQWGCETVTCQKNKDGSFTATFAGLSQDGLGALYYDYALDLSALGESIYLSDATVVIHSTPDLRFKSATYSLTFTQYAAEGSYGYPDEQYRTSASYRDGTMVFKETDPKGEKSSGSYDYTEGDVRNVIAAELTLQDFSPVYVTRIEAVDEQAGKYRFHLGASLHGEYADYFYKLSGSLRYMDAYMDVTLREGELMELALYVYAEGYTETAKSHEYEMKVTCTFSEKNTSSAPV